MTNLQDAETIVTIGGSGTLTRTKRGYYHGYQKRDGKLHCGTSTDISIITGLHANPFSIKDPPPPWICCTTIVHEIILS